MALKKPPISEKQAWKSAIWSLLLIVASFFLGRWYENISSQYNHEVICREYLDALEMEIVINKYLLDGYIQRADKISTLGPREMFGLVA